MSDVIAKWRAALRDQADPRSRAAWLLFAEPRKLDYMVKVLEPQRELLIPDLLEIVAQEDLYDEGSFGDGWGPVNAVGLIGQWRVQEAVPHLFWIVKHMDWESQVITAALQALIDFKPGLEAIMDFAADVDADKYMAVAELLAETCQGEDRAYAWVDERLREKEDDEMEAEIYSSFLLDINFEQAEPRVRALMKRTKWSDRLQKILPDVIAYARERREEAAASLAEDEAGPSK